MRSGLFVNSKSILVLDRLVILVGCSINCVRLKESVIFFSFFLPPLSLQLTLKSPHQYNLLIKIQTMEDIF